MGANRTKTVTFSGAAGFAVVRGLTERLEKLQAKAKALADDETPYAQEMRTYITQQIAGVHAAFAAMNAADFTLAEVLS
jgi:cell division protein FtsB